jgi:hypothetical protein
VSVANTWAPISPIDFLVKSTRGSRMLTALIVLLRSIGLICGGHRAVVLENLALRQQLAVLTRTVKRPQLRSTDRLFWILLAKGWRDWRSALVVVQPDTVVRWHRQWLRRHWTRLSRRTHPGRPTTSSAIRALVSTMTTANPRISPIIMGREHISPWRRTRRLTRLAPAGPGATVVTSDCAARPRVRFPRRFNAIIFVMASGRGIDGVPSPFCGRWMDFGERHRLHASVPHHAGIIVCTLDLDFAGQARRIPAAITPLTTLAGCLVRVNRPAV